MAQQQTPDTAKLAENNPDNIIEDQKSLAIKDKVMHRLKTNTWLNSVSKVAMYAGTLLTTAGTGMALTSIIASAPVSAAVIGILAIGAAVIGVGIAADYMASRIWQGANFDNLEANADSTARHLVKELKANNMCLVNEQDVAAQNTQANWTARVATPQSQQQADWASRIDAQNQQQAAAERTA